MPKAPTVPGPQVQTEALPGVRMAPNASPDQWGAGLAQGVQDVGRVLGQIAMQERAKADESALNDATAQATLAANRTQIAHRQMQGQQALEAVPELEDGWNKQLDEIEAKTLTTDGQRRAFRQWRTRQGVELTTSLESHAATEREKQYDADYAARRQANLDRAVLNKGDPAAISAAYAEISQATSAYARARRLSPDQQNLANTADATAFWGGLVESHLADGNDLAAAQILDQYKGIMDAKAVTQLSDRVALAKDRGDTKRVATTVMAQQPENPATPPDMEAAMAAVETAGKGMKPEVIDDAKALVARNLRLRYEAHNDTQAGIEYRILTMANDAENPAGFDSKPVQDLWRQLDPIRAAKVKAAMTKMEEPDETTSRMALRNYELLLTQKDAKARDAVLAAGPAEATAGMPLNKEDRKAAVDLWYKAKQAKAGDANAQRELEGLQTKGDAVMGVLRAGGLDLKKDGDGNYDPKTAAALDWVDREGKAMQASRTDRKPLTSDDWKVIAGKALVQQKLVGAGFFGGDQLKATAQMQADLVVQIPTQHRAGIEEAFNATHGRMPTYTELLTAWAVYQQQHPEVKPAPTADQRRERSANAARATMFFGPF